MTPDAADDGISPSQSPDDSADPDSAEMVEQSSRKPGSQPQSGSGQTKSSSSAKDPLRPRRKKARRACYACQRAHLTCGDERPCQRCIKRGLQDACHDGLRKKAKYLHDAPNEALMPGIGVRGPAGNPMHYLTNMGRGQPLPSNANFPTPSTNDVYAQQQTMPPTFSNFPPTGPPSQMGPPLPENMASAQPYSNQQSPISPHYSSGPSHQASPMQSMANALQQNQQASQSMMQSTFGGNGGGGVFDVNDPMQYNFDPASFNFGNHYGALEFGMLGHMSSGAAETPPTEGTSQLSGGNGANYATPGTLSTGFGSSPTNAQSYFFPPDQALGDWQGNPHSGLKQAPFDPNASGQDPTSIQMTRHDGLNAFSIGAGSSSFASPSESSSSQGIVTGFDDTSATGSIYPVSNARQGMHDRPAQQRQPISRIQTPIQAPPPAAPQRARNPSTIYESVKQPYSYTSGFHGLTALLQRRFSPQKTLRIAKALASIRPSFIACTKTLNRDDLVFMEKCFQRTLWEYESFINAYGTPTIVCRRTGEVAAVGKEFSILTGWRKDVLLGKEANLNVNMGGNSGQPSTAVSSRGGYNTPRTTEPPKPESYDGSRPQPVFLAELLDDESAIGFYEDFARLAFGDSRGSVMTKCKLLKYKTKKDMETGAIKREEFNAEIGSRARNKRQGTRNGKNGITGEPGDYQLVERDGKVECSYCWTVKRDVFDIPMLIVMNFLPCI